jgi:sorbose reductase
MGDSGSPVAAIPSADERAALVEREIPRMVLSTEENPLTRPLPPISERAPQARALARFAVQGHCVLTGGAGGLGLCAARALLEHGAAGVFLFDLPSTLASPTSIEDIECLRKDFPDRLIRTVPCNVIEEQMVEAAFAEADKTAKEAGGRLTTICCFAGTVGCVPSDEVTSTAWRRMLDINTTGSFLCAQKGAKYISDPNAPDSERGGSILFIASISGHATNFPQPQVAYNVSKAAVIHMTKGLAAEWASRGIRVNCVSPGYMDTILNAGDKLAALRKMWADKNPMGRMGDVEEVVSAVIMCCSQRAGRYMTGSEIIVDGGALCF